MKCNPSHLAILPLLLLVACGSARRSEPLGTRFAPATETLKSGEKVFYEYCNKCHTGGEASLGPALNNKPLPGFMLRLQVRRGMGAMPAFPKEQIDDRELDRLVEYVKALRRRG